MDAIFDARWITSPEKDYSKVWEFSLDFSFDGEVKSAVLYSSAIGTYTARINGAYAPVYPLAPGWTTYKKRIQYQKTDVSAMISRGENTVSLGVGRGFLCHEISHDKYNVYLEGLDGGGTAVIAALVINDGEKIIYTGSDFSVSETCWRFSDIYCGDVYDATFRAEKTLRAVVLGAGTEKLIPQEGEPVCENERLPVKEIITTPSGETVLDFGQNMTGYPEFTVTGKVGGRCRLVCGEVLDKRGNFYRDNYRDAKAETVFICDGKTHTFKPRYTFYGFRYLKVEEWPEEVKPESFTAVVVHSDMRRTGNFECSDARLNQLYHNIIWGQKSNFLDVPTDCPQRNERLGWTGDAQVFCGCAAMNFDVRKFFKKWLGDMRAAQGDDGIIGYVIPSAIYGGSAAAWSDACTIVPWTLYRRYGDESFLSDNIEMMERWVKYLRDNFDEYTSKEKHHFGDWLAVERRGRTIGLTPKPFIAAAFSAYSTELLIKSLRVLGEDTAEYEKFYAICREKIRREFCDEEEFDKNCPEHDFTLKTQTYYVLRLTFSLYDSDEERRGLAKKLYDMVTQNGDRLTTGFVGTPYLLFALSRNGYEKTAYSLLLQNKYPSWLYCVERGATTIWERWNGIEEDGEICEGKGMNSFNHYAYGSVGDWMYSEAAGIKPDMVSKTVEFSPITDGRLSFVRASYDTDLGTIASSWETKDGKTEYLFTVPTGLTATAVIGGKTYSLIEGGNRIVI